MHPGPGVNCAVGGDVMTAGRVGIGVKAVWDAILFFFSFFSSVDEPNYCAEA